LANALCLVAGMKFCAARRPGIYRRIGIACGLDVMGGPDGAADERTIAFIGRFLEGLGLSGRLREHGADPGQIETLAAQAYEDPCHKTNAAPVSKEDIRRLYAEVL
jgi:alcohol dehydrogenase class IV